MKQPAKQASQTIRHAEIAECFGDFTKPYRFRFFYGGRGGGKSWAIARALLVLSLQRPLRILCARESQKKIDESVKHLLEEQIEVLGVGRNFKILRDRILGTNGSYFFFLGVRTNPQSIKGTEAVDICWVEEAEFISDLSLRILRPTIRAPGSEIWFTFNPHREGDPVYRMMNSLRGRENTFIAKVSWRDNPWFTKELDEERRLFLETDPDMYEHVWEGACLKMTAALVFRNKFEVKEFDTPMYVRFFHGVDWGFSQDPTTMVRCFIQDDCLFIDRHVYGVGVELDELPSFFSSIETARDWPIKADCARPETISYLSRLGFDISGAEKWQGSVQDGIEYLRGFRKIYIHPRCEEVITEFMNYSYKTDRINGDILPIVEDKWNHCIDALRYALDGYIRSNDGVEIFARLADG